MTHGARALERLLREGLAHDHPIGVLLHQRRTAYVGDLGGEDALSEMEMGLVERLAKLDLFEALLDARLIDPATGRTRRLSWQRLHSLGLLRVRLGDSYARMAGALGLRRREKPTEDIIEAARALAREQEREWQLRGADGEGQNETVEEHTGSAAG
jgi:hypothetical protein